EQANYRGTEYIGKLGVEQSYEKELHGTTGTEQVETSAGGRAVRKLASTPATSGNTVMLSIDIKLQKLVEDLYGDRRGAMVALDPRNGEVLAFVSKPTFDPNLFVDGIDHENWQALNESIDKPLLNRALRGTYPPGSTYKPFMALAALETGKRSATQITQDTSPSWRWPRWRPASAPPPRSPRTTVRGASAATCSAATATTAWVRWTCTPAS
ncbi:MAG: pbp2, partial [Ramlibacter sp.]|nr:pbp2 [Ramlibacter sp.]